MADWDAMKKRLDESIEMAELAEMEEDADLLASLNDELSVIEKDFDKLERLMLFSEETDKSNAFLNIHPGAGGTESQDWAEMLLRMYQRWAENHGFTAEIINLEPGDVAGIKDATVYVKGRFAFGHLKCENGIHRLVRLSPFNANNKRQTSFCSIHISPEADDNIEIEINEKDLRIDVFRASGAGGQHVNKTSSAVRITHLPTGIVASCQNERSQLQNKDFAMKVLKSRLYELELAKKEAEDAEKALEKKSIEWGNQIRSYVFQPYTMAKDHRTNVEKGNINAVMDGDLDDFIFAFLKQSLGKEG